MTKLIHSPGTDDHGYAYGTFDGVYETETRNAKGKQTTVAAEFVTDTLTPGQTVVLRVFLSGYYGEKNTTGRFSKAMGFEYKAEYGVTEEGVRQVVSDNLDELDGYLDGLIGNRYKFKLYTSDNGFDNIDVSTIRLANTEDEDGRKRKTFSVA